MGSRIYIIIIIYILLVILTRAEVLARGGGLKGEELSCIDGL